MNRRIALLAALAVGLSACSSQTPSPTTSASASEGPQSSPTASPATTAPPSTATPQPTETGLPLATLIGQKLVIRMDGTTPSASLLGRIRRGEIGGVILFAFNIVSAAQLTALTTQLRQAAADGGQPPFLIATDQEGGSVKRVPWAPPTLSPPQMAADGLPATAFDQGFATGGALRELGINVDLAPVADVPATKKSFMYLEGRTFSFDAPVVSSLAGSFASGLASASVVGSMKHFPGIGFAELNTDRNVVTIKASRDSLAAGLTPYSDAMAGDGLELVMLSNAIYPAYDPDNAAGWSAAISTGLLRNELGFGGCSITDSLNGIAKAMGVAPRTLAIKAAIAGTDLLLLTGTEASTITAHDALVAAATDGTIPRDTLDQSYQRILTLKDRYLVGP
jgi:beta-N-acetylhexosaminidase